MKTVSLLILACMAVVLFALLTWNRDTAAPATGPNYRSSRAAASTPVPWPFRSPAPVSPSQYSSSSVPASQSSLSAADTSPDIFSKALAALQRGFHSASEHHTTCRRSQLKIVRGIVLDHTETGIVLDCSGWIVHGTQVPVYPGDGEGMNILYANLVDAHEQFQFGRLLMVNGGAARQSLYDRSTWTLDSYVNGRVLLKNYPAPWPAKGKGFKVVAVPDGEEAWQGDSVVAYTASFTLLD
ncbi:MAG TPA: hypothetical protein VGM54_17390 [Chthoniobacter sp.]|jgi:hypothetical protein